MLDNFDPKVVYLATLGSAGDPMKDQFLSSVCVCVSRLLCVTAARCFLCVCVEASVCKAALFTGFSE